MRIFAFFLCAYVGLYQIILLHLLLMGTLCSVELMFLDPVM